MPSLKEVLDKLFQRAVEEWMESVEAAPFFSSKENVRAFVSFLQTKAHDLFNLPESDLQKHFEELGKEIYLKYHLSSFVLDDFLKKIREDLLYAIVHEIVAYDDEEFLKRFDGMAEGLYAGYLQATVKDTLRYSYAKISSVDPELDIFAHERWYQSLLHFLLEQKAEPPVLIYEDSEVCRWIDTLDFKLLMKACSFEKESEIVIFLRKLFDIARELRRFVRNGDFRNAYASFMTLDQKVKLVSDMLESVLLQFLEEKMHYFFSLFAEIILFKKQYSYFLTITVSLSSEAVHKRDAHRLFVEILRRTKRRASEIACPFTGVVDDGDSMHFLLQYQQQSDIDEIFSFVVNTIDSLKKEEIVLNVPNFIVRASQTEMFSGLDAASLQEIAFAMAREHVDMPYYHFDAEESKQLREHIHGKTILDSRVKEAVQEGRIKLYYQPIVRIDKESRSLAYCEVLARIEEDGKIYDAESFIHSIIEQKLTDELDLRIFEKLKAQTPKIAKILEGVSLNIFPSSFLNEKVMEALKAVLESFARYDMKLILEITEYNLFECYSILAELKKKYTDTLQIAVDDFGSGYSSIATLIKLAKKGLLDKVKIDGTLTKEILDDESSFEILKMAAEIGCKLGANTIVEYVENEAIEKKLSSEIDTYYAQGYHYSKAVTLADLGQLQKKIEKHQLL